MPLTPHLCLGMIGYKGLNYRILSMICMADLPILLLAGSVLGAALNIIRGVSNDTTGKLNYKKVIGGGVTAIVAALGAVVALDSVAIVEPTTQLVVGVLVGFGSDFAISKLKKD